MGMKTNLIAIPVGIFTALGVLHLVNYAVGNEPFLKDKAALSEALEHVAHLKDKNYALRQRVTILEEKLNRMGAGVRGINPIHVRRVVRATLDYLGVEDDGWEQLMMLTVATESDMGRHLKQVLGPARGIWQIEPETEKDVLAWLRKYDAPMHQRIEMLRTKAELGIHEMEYNLAYSAAVAVNVYRMRKVCPVDMSLEEMAMAYKKHYNTELGKGTVDRALNKAKAYGVDDGGKTK